MAGYFTRPKSDYWADPTQGATIVVHDDHAGPVKTGIIDKYGRGIMRAPDRQAAGFVHFGGVSHSRPRKSPPGRKA